MAMDKFTSWKVDPRVSKLVEATCFKNFLKLERAKMKLNRPLLTALMSNFDAKSLAFSSEGGNSMVDFGLEDILYITGLPINGKQVSGYETSDTISTITTYLKIREETALGLSKDDVSS